MGMTPFERGYQDGLNAKPGPVFPTPDSSWAERLYNRGWKAQETKGGKEALVDA